MLEADPSRPVWETIVEALRVLDTLMRASVADVIAGQTDVDTLNRLAGLARQAANLASAAITTKAVEMLAEVDGRWGDVVVERIGTLLGDHLGLPSYSDAVQTAMDSCFSNLDLNAPTVVPRPDGPTLMARVAVGVAEQFAGRCGLPAQQVAAWHQQLVVAVANSEPIPGLPPLPVGAVCED